MSNERWITTLAQIHSVKKGSGLIGYLVQETLLSLLGKEIKDGVPEDELVYIIAMEGRCTLDLTQKTLNEAKDY